MAKQGENLIRLTDEQLARVISALEYQYDSGDTLEQHETNLALAKDIKGQSKQSTKASAVAEQLNAELRERESNLYVDPDRVGFKGTLYREDPRSSNIDQIGHYSLNITAEGLIAIARVHAYRFDEGVTEGRKQHAAALRDLLGVAADPRHELSE